MATIFSKIISGEIPGYKIAENDRFFAFLDISPLTKGHTLLVPKQETDYIFDLDDELLKEMIVYAKKIAVAIKSAVPCNRVAVMVMGLEVPHAHIHLLPIESEDDLDLKKPHLRLSPEEFEEIAAAIRKEMK